MSYVDILQFVFTIKNVFLSIIQEEVKAVGVVVDHGGKGEEDTTPAMPNSDDVSPENPPPSTADPGEEIQAVKSQFYIIYG